MFGDNDVVPLIGYECDGAPWCGATGSHAPRAGTGRRIRLRCWELLSSAHDGPLQARDQWRPWGLTLLHQAGPSSMERLRTGPCCLSWTATWARITQNVLDHLSLPSVRILGPVPTAGGAWPQEGTPLQVYVDLRLSSRRTRLGDLRDAWEDLRGKPQAP